MPGGTTPGPIFDTLSGVDLDWANVAVVLNDERWVPEAQTASNTRLLRERLLRGRAAQARLVPLYAPADTPEEMLAALEDGLRPHLPISVLLLGMGGGHAHRQPVPRRRPAGRGAVATAPRSCCRCGPKRPESRAITLTAPVLTRGDQHPYPDHRAGKARGA